MSLEYTYKEKFKMSEKMSLTRALAELKMLDKRIDGKNK